MVKGAIVGAAVRMPLPLPRDGSVKRGALVVAVRAEVVPCLVCHEDSLTSALG